MARTDALQSDMIFTKGVGDLMTYRRFSDVVGVPVLANITEFGATPLFTRQPLGPGGVALIMYPLSAFRAVDRLFAERRRAERGDAS
jgi:methylisocitrate lyase